MHVFRAPIKVNSYTSILFFFLSFTFMFFFRLI